MAEIHKTIVPHEVYIQSKQTKVGLFFLANHLSNDEHEKTREKMKEKKKGKKRPLLKN